MCCTIFVPGTLNEMFQSRWLKWSGHPPEGAYSANFTWHSSRV